MECVIEVAKSVFCNSWMAPQVESHLNAFFAFFKNTRLKQFEAS